MRVLKVKEDKDHPHFCTVCIAANEEYEAHEVTYDAPENGGYVRNQHDEVVCYPYAGGSNALTWAPWQGSLANTLADHFKVKKEVV